MAPYAETVSKTEITTQFSTRMVAATRILHASSTLEVLLLFGTKNFSAREILSRQRSFLGKERLAKQGQLPVSIGVSVELKAKTQLLQQAEAAQEVDVK
jgi:hypothetical protein